MLWSTSIGFRTALQLGIGCVLNAVVLVASLSPVHARVLEPMPVQKLVPGQMLRYPIVWHANQGRRVQILLGRAPAGARLVVNGSGSLFVQWNTTPQMPAETLIEVVAMDVDSGEELDTRYLLVRAQKFGRSLPVTARPASTYANAHSAEQAGKSVPSDSADSSIRSKSVLPREAPSGMHDDDNPTVAAEVRDSNGIELTDRIVSASFDPKPIGSYSAVSELRELALSEIAVEPDAPVLTAIANQVVSAGRVVALRVEATIANGTQAVIQVDRLPQNASFDSSSDGSRTFYWQTGDRDQGEHLYRFTAINPNEAYLRDHQEVMIIVGDPSRNKTRPAQPLPPSIE